ncbi:MAG: 4-hydroxy-3-methylbut-2-enyl diphosphate reductase [Legionellales bacterium]|nr:4-hydroxy-3-methylbut-2-enyl diphosphate reductase [Legionellales bacterium]|tara:strand:- start:1025 stop:1987 length:963 start_codon:yes stop_codon:yes gene_type:complete
MKIKLASPRGFCAGVDRAILIVERALERFAPPIYVRHEVVHNRYVVEELKAKGVIFVEELSEVPDDSILIFSAHGVAKAVRKEAGERGFEVFDATCPLVTKVHTEVTRAARLNQECILIGHSGHVEVIGTLGQYTKSEGKIYLVENELQAQTIQVQNPDFLCYVTQTTLSVDETKAIVETLRQRFPNISGPKKDDICYATQNRQDAVRALTAEVDVMLVVGSRNSSNSNRLRELAEFLGVDAYLIDSAEQIDKDWFKKDSVVGITAGASAPEVLVQEVVSYLKQNWQATVDQQSGPSEDIHFSLPGILRYPQDAKAEEPA